MFSTPENASKRFEDTAVLIGEYLSHDPREERTLRSIARMNYLHSPYLKSGKISNDDLLYTLSVFVTEPINWINQFEWRNLTDYEVCGIGTFWKSMGDAMEINFKGVLKRETWEDGLEFYEDLKEWAQNYEAKKMVPVASNKQTADELVPLLLHYIPRPLVPFSRQVVGVLMGERLRWAMRYIFVLLNFPRSYDTDVYYTSSFPEPTILAHAVTFLTLYSRRFVLRYLTLPRFFPVSEFTDKDPKTGRYYHNTYLVHPYYVKPSFINRWGPTAWITWVLGGILPGGRDGKRYHPEGYSFEEIGPDRKKGLGKNEMDVLEQKIKVARPLGCPFAITK